MQTNKTVNQKFLLNYTAYFLSVNGYFTIPIICIVGFILNFICLLILLNQKNKLRTFFKYLIIKIVIEQISLMSGFFFQNYLTCIFENNVLANECSEKKSFAFTIFRLLFYKFLEPSIFVVLGYIELVFNYDRLLCIQNIKNWFNKSKNSLYLVMIPIACILIIFIPTTLSYSVARDTKTTHLFYLEPTRFGKNVYYNVYFLITLTGANILSVVLLIYLSILIVVAYKKFTKNHFILTASISIKTKQLQLKNKNNEQKRQYQLNAKKINERTKKNRKITHMMITVDILYIIARIMSIATTLSFGIWGNLINNGNNIFIVYVINFFYIVNFSFKGSNFLVLFKFNKNFRQTAKKFIKIFKN